MNVEELAGKLAARGFTVVRHGENYRAQCPGHGGKDCNLELKPRPGGGVEVHCYSHDCDLKTIAGAVGLSTADFFPARANGGAGHEPEAVYPYRDEQGKVLFYAGRFPGKQFRQWREVQGQRVWSLGNNTRRVLFGLPELLKTQPGDLVAIVEGEKDAVAVASEGIAATTNPMGAGKWRQEYTDWFKERLPDREYVILSDNDPQGEQHAEEVFHSLKRAGLDVRRVALSGLPPKGDVSDWLPANKGKLPQALARPRHPLSLAVMDGGKLAALSIPEPEALVPNLLYRGFSTLLAGDSKLGKSSLLLRMMLAMATGGWWLDRERREENRLPASRVLFLNFEDPLYLTRQRAMRMLAPDRLPAGFLTMEPPYGFTLPEIIDWLGAAAREFGMDAVVLDPIALAAEWEREDDNAQVALTFKALQRLAAETRLAVLSAHHVTKKPGSFGVNIRGASAIKANVLGYLVLERERDGIRLSGINKMTGEWDVRLGRSEDDYSWWIEESFAGNTRTPQQAMKAEAKADLLILLTEHPGADAERVAALLDLPERTVRDYLRELEEEAFIFSHERPREEGQRGPNVRGWYALGDYGERFSANPP